MVAEASRTTKAKIGTLAIDNFRALQRLTVSGLGRVNLITGRNNTGKSSLLEALRILASNGSPFVVSDILQYREEDLREADDSGRPLDLEGAFPFGTLFNGFPSFATNIAPIVIATNDGSKPMRLSISAEWLFEERDDTGIRKLVPRQIGLFGGDEAVNGVPSLVFEAAGFRRQFPLDYMWRRRYESLSRREPLDEAGLPWQFVNAYGGERTVTLAALWDKAALNSREQDVVEALRIIDPRISGVLMVGGETPRRSRTAVVRATHLPRPVPLRSFGDGLNRLFGIVVSLVNAKDGILLVDEFENGMHYTVQLDAWRAVFKLSRLLDVQVFATTHSWDSIEAFQKAAAESPEDGAIVRLARKGDAIVPTVFAEVELAIATRERIEVR